MRKLSPEEFAQLPIKGKGRSSVVFNSLINLKEGEGLLIEQKDWNRKAAPSALYRKKIQHAFFVWCPCKRCWLGSAAY
jgi:hypothetical protein